MREKRVFCTPALPVEEEVGLHFDHLISFEVGTYRRYRNSARKLARIAGQRGTNPATADLAFSKLVEALRHVRAVAADAHPEEGGLNKIRAKKSTSARLQEKAIVMALASCNHPDAVRHLLNETDHPDWQVLFAVLKRLVNEKHSDTPAALERHKEHEVLFVRERVRTLLDNLQKKVGRFSKRSHGH